MKHKFIPFVIVIFCATITTAQNVGVGTNAPGSKFTVSGSLGVGYNNIAATGTAPANTPGASDYYILYNGTFSTMTLPAAVSGAGNFIGRIYVIRNNYTAALTIAASTTLSEKIDGAASITLQPGYTVELISTGATTSGSTTWNVKNITQSGTSTNDWIQATTSSTPAANANNQYVTGNVGIGNFSASSPAAPLDVQAPITATTAATYGTRLQQTLTTHANNDALTALYINPTFTNTGSYTGTVDNGLVVAAGNVGIGTAAPSSLLSNSTVNPIGFDGNGVNLSGLVWTAASGGYVADIYQSGTCASCDGLAVKLNAAATGRILDLSVGSSGSYSGAGATSVMVAMASGLVGIGIGVPTQTLHVYTATNGTGVLLDGPATGTSIAYQLGEAGTAKAAVGLTGNVNDWTSGAAIGDLVIRDVSQKILFNTNGGSAISICLYPAVMSVSVSPLPVVHSMSRAVLSRQPVRPCPSNS